MFFQLENLGKEGKNRRREGNNYNKVVSDFVFVKTPRTLLTYLLIAWHFRKNH